MSGLQEVGNVFLYLDMFSTSKLGDANYHRQLMDLAVKQEREKEDSNSPIKYQINSSDFSG